MGRPARLDWSSARRVIIFMICVCVTSTTGCQRQTMSNDAFSNSTLAPLADAVVRGDVAEIKRQLVHVDPDTPGQDGATLVLVAIGAESLPATRALLEGGADPNRPGGGGETPVHAAAFVADPAFLQSVLAHGGDPNVRNPITNGTPLSRALLGPHLDNVRILLDVGANPNLGDNNHDAPLHMAARTNSGQAIMMLLEAGAAATATNSRGASFQAYYFSYPPRNVLSQRALDERGQIVEWLKTHHVALEANVAADY